MTLAVAVATVLAVLCLVWVTVGDSRPFPMLYSVVFVACTGFVLSVAVNGFGRRAAILAPMDDSRPHEGARSHVH
jgi:hypothetical protein